MPTSHATVDQRLQYVHMKGQDVFKAAVKNLLSTRARSSAPA